MNAPSPSSVSGGDTDADKANLGSSILTAESRASTLHARIMNLPHDAEGRLQQFSAAELFAYRLGHRDVRHAAAELVLQALSDSPPPLPTSPSEQDGCSCSLLREALTEILSIEPMSPEGGHEAVAEIHSIARAALKGEPK